VPGRDDGRGTGIAAQQRHLAEHLARSVSVHHAGGRAGEDFELAADADEEGLSNLAGRAHRIAAVVGDLDETLGQCLHLAGREASEHREPLQQLDARRRRARAAHVDASPSA
jgi:hypothetical protein